MNYRDLQNISNLSQQILVEGANEEHNVLNRWPYTSPYLQDDIMEKEDSPYEKASDAALDARYGYGRATGPKTSFGRAANRASAAAMLRRLRRDRDEGRTTSRESGADAVHQGWAHTARTSSDQTPEKKERRAKLADTPYSQLPNDEQEKDRVSADAVRALYNRRNQREDFDLYDIILSHLLDEGYAETQEQAEVIMVNMSEDWRESIFEAEVLAQKGGVPGTVQMNKTREGGFLGIGSKEVSKPVPGSFKAKDVSSKDAARYNTGIDKKFGSADNIDDTSAANVQYAANRAGHSGYMKVKDPGSLPDTGIPNRPSPGRASDQNQARQMSGDIVRMNRR